MSRCLEISISRAHVKNAFFVFFMLLTSCLGREGLMIKTSSYIIDVGEAQQWMVENTNWTLFEISKPSKYTEGHIAGAHRLWREDYSNQTDYEFGGMRASKKQLEDLLGKYGVGSRTKILLYDTKGNVDAARFAWQLELFGFTNFLLINGGKEGWKQTNLPLTKAETNLPKSKVFSFKDQPENQSLIASKEEVLNGITDGKVIIVDTREDYEFIGAPFIKQGKIHSFKKGAFDRGAIPSAIHYNWSNMVDLSFDHKIKNKESIQYDLQKAGIDPNKKIIVYCQSGVRSAHTSFVLRHILGYPNVKNYDGSWIEWSYEAKNGLENPPILKQISEDDFQQLYKDLE